MTKRDQITDLIREHDRLSDQQMDIQKRKQEIQKKIDDLNNQPDDPQEIAKAGHEIISRWRGTTVDLDENTVARYVMQLEDEVRKLKGRLSKSPASWTMEETRGEITIKLGYRTP